MAYVLFPITTQDTCFPQPASSMMIRLYQMTSICQSLTATMRTVLSELASCCPLLHFTLHILWRQSSNCPVSSLWFVYAVRFHAWQCPCQHQLSMSFQSFTSPVTALMMILNFITTVYIVYTLMTTAFDKARILIQSKYHCWFSWFLVLSPANSCRWIQIRNTRPR